MTDQTPKTDHLALYAYPTCPFCRRVSKAIDDLGLEVEYRNIHQDRAAYQALLQARGRGTVPVLRIDGEGGDTWMPESADIVDYLYKEFGNGRTPPRSGGLFGLFG
ncbi:MAG: glutaredoxin family protein [Bradymonadia bacterium]